MRGSRPIGMERCRCLPFVLIAGVCLTSWGCGGKSSIAGSVTLDGAPVADAQVTFIGAGDNPGSGGFAKTGPDGKFVVPARPGGQPALKPGKYIVVVTRLVDKDKKVPSEEDFGQLEAAGLLHSTLPLRYANREDPALVIDIKSGDKTVPTFELKSR